MRDRTKLHPKLQKKLNELIAACDKAGLKIQITECVRTVAEQDALYAQGRTKPGKIVTNARGSTYSSMHMWGVAADFCRADGKAAYENKDGFFDKVGKIGQKLGLEWGGSWKSPVDKPHFQLSEYGSTTAKLKLLYGTPEKFFKTWNGTHKSSSTTNDTKEEYDMNTIQKGATGRAVKVWQIIIGVSPDGDFGDKTVAATKKFQKSHNLTVDGIVGKKTWNVGLKSL